MTLRKMMAEELQKYAKPTVPMLPVMSFRSGWGRRTTAILSMADAGTLQLVSSGRVALARSLQCLELKKEDLVLVPAYNCESMISPILWHGCQFALYRLNGDLSVDMNDIEGKLSSRVRAIIAVHYFGFPQQLDGLRTLCDERNIALIEDCAHAFYGTFGNSAPGAVGDFAIGSATKFFPVTDGGFLLSRRFSVPTANLTSGGPVYELRCLFDLLETASNYGRLGALGTLIRGLRALVNKGKMANTENTRSAKSVPSENMPAFHDMDNRRVNTRMSRAASAIVKFTSSRHQIEARRNNFEYYSDVFRNLAGCRAIFPQLPDMVVPYVFPLYIDQIDRVFPALKNRGIPIYRWDNSVQSICPVSADYAMHLLQLPCHQSLSCKERNWISSQFREVLQQEVD